jgi:hypothetical protein
MRATPPPSPTATGASNPRSLRTRKASGSDGTAPASSPGGDRAERGMSSTALITPRSGSLS